MAGFVLATADELVEKDWGVIVECQGIDFESGGTMTILASYLPSRNFKMHHFDLAAAKKLTSNELIVQQMAKDFKPRLNRSAQEARFLSLDFVLRAGDGIATWLLCRDVQSIVRAVAEFCRSHGGADLPNAEIIVRAILTSLRDLDCWLNINNSTFRKVHIAMSQEDARRLGLEYHEADEGWAVIGVKGVV